MIHFSFPLHWHQVLGFTMLAACYFLQQLWLHVRKLQCDEDSSQARLAVKPLDCPPPPALQYFSLLECIVQDKFSPRVAVAARRWTLAMQVCTS